MSDRDLDFFDMFPENWACIYCMAEGEYHSMPRHEILTHVKTFHPDSFRGELTWEILYKRLAMIGGVL